MKLLEIKDLRDNYPHSTVQPSEVHRPFTSLMAVQHWFQSQSKIRCMTWPHAAEQLFFFFILFCYKLLRLLREELLTIIIMGTYCYYFIIIDHLLLRTIRTRTTLCIYN